MSLGATLITVEARTDLLSLELGGGLAMHGGLDPACVRTGVELSEGEKGEGDRSVWCSNVGWARFSWLSLWLCSKGREGRRPKEVDKSDMWS